MNLVCQNKKHPPPKKNPFCAFINFKQAFDDVWRNGLWYKLLNNGINDECLTFFRNMYNGDGLQHSLNEFHT